MTPDRLQRPVRLTGPSVASRSWLQNRTGVLEQLESLGCRSPTDTPTHLLTHDVQVRDECATPGSERSYRGVSRVVVTPGLPVSSPADQVADWVEDLYRQHAAAVYSHCLQRRLGPVDAQDVVSEVFVVAVRKQQAGVMPYADADAGMLPWLLVVCNHVLSGRRRSQVRAERALLTMAVAPAADQHPDIADDVVDRSQAAADLQLVAAVLARLSEKDQDILQLCYLRGFAPVTVARLTGEVPGTVRARLSRATARARLVYAALIQSSSLESQP